MTGEKTLDKNILKYRLKRTDLPRIRQKLIVEQKGSCPICKRDLKGQKVTPSVDHDHLTGFIRGVLCVNCNGLIGKINNLLNRIDVRKRGHDAILHSYVEYHDKEPTRFIYPSHQTEAEKKTSRNLKARKKYAASKKVKG